MQDIPYSPTNVVVHEREQRTQLLRHFLFARAMYVETELALRPELIRPGKGSRGRGVVTPRAGRTLKPVCVGFD